MRIQGKHFNVFYYLFLFIAYLIDRKALSFLKDDTVVNEIFHPLKGSNLLFMSFMFCLIILMLIIL